MEIGEPIGNWQVTVAGYRSTYGHVYRVQNQNQPTQTGLLLYLKPVTDREDFLDWFQQESETWLRLQHPGLLPVVDIGTWQDRAFVVYQDPPGESLDSRLRAGWRPTWQEVLPIAYGLVRTVRYLHHNSQLHAGWRGDNIYISATGELVLAEYGLQKLLGTTPVYDARALCQAAMISPQQAAGKSPTKRCDFYSLGVLLYTLTTGRPPFRATNLVEFIRQHGFVLPDRPNHYVPDLPDEVDYWLMRLLAKDPQHRPISASKLLQEFDQLWASLEARKLLPKKPAPTNEPEIVTDSAEQPALGSQVSFLPESARPPKTYRPLFSRPWVVIPAFLLVVGLLIAGFYRKRVGAEELYQAGLPLLQSNQPEDWESAWTLYFSKLEADYPGRYPNEVAAAKQKVQPLLELRRALGAAQLKKKSSNEPQRLYRTALKLYEGGNVTAARATWQRILLLFGSMPEYSAEIELCRLALDRTETPTVPAGEGVRLQQLTPVLERMHFLRGKGEQKAADEIQSALVALYQDDPDWPEIQKRLAFVPNANQNLPTP
ncbi:MAG: serine/threonine-protein kinase [Zavarzinella sp.]